MALSAVEKRRRRAEQEAAKPQPIPTCRCIPSPAFDGQGNCFRCGRSILERCPHTGLTTPECACANCLRKLVAKHRPTP